MANLNQSDFLRLRTASELKGKIREVLSVKEIIELAEKKIIPHYILTNPLTKEETYCFMSSEVNEWYINNYIKREECDYEQNLVFLKLDYKDWQVSHEDAIPAELSMIRNLYKFPFKSSVLTPTVVYFLCNKGKMVYVGQTVNLSTRVNQHLQSDKKFTDVFFIPCQPGTVERIEASLITHFQPEYNVKIYNSPLDEVNSILNTLNKQN